jgi:hypothetical protein
MLGTVTIFKLFPLFHQLVGLYLRTLNGRFCTIILVISLLVSFSHVPLEANEKPVKAFPSQESNDPLSPEQLLHFLPSNESIYSGSTIAASAFT